MKITTSVLSILLSVFISSCGAVDKRFCYAYGEDCEKSEVVETTTETTTIVQGTPGRAGRDGVDSKVPGPRGQPGSNGDSVVGPRGDDGTSCTVVDTSYGADITCGLETVSIFDGSNGVDGIAGESCSVVQTPTGATITCGLDTATVDHGEDGADAPYAISEVIDPCNDGPGPDEVILVFATGEWVAWYSGLGLIILTPGGSYVTTDQQACQFSVPL